jgi:hypothetical protein
MRSSMPRRTALVFTVVLVIAVFTKLAFFPGGIGEAQLMLAAAGCLFALIVVRLSQAMFDALPERRRRARRRLVVLAAVPALILTPTAIEAAPREYAPMILLASAVWVALAMSYTSFVVARAGQGADDTLSYRPVSDEPATPATASSGKRFAPKVPAPSYHAPSSR